MVSIEVDATNSSTSAPQAVVNAAARGDRPTGIGERVAVNTLAAKRGRRIS